MRVREGARVYLQGPSRPGDAHARRLELLAMNRSIILLGVGILLFAFALIAYPIATTGQEAFDLEQEAGIYLIPPALAVLLVGSISTDPRGTTIGGRFGNPDADLDRRAGERPAPDVTGPRYNPHEPARCRYCGSIILAEYAQCPRCARARECRTCNRPLGLVLDRATCPTCARPESRCHCIRITLRPIPTVARGRRV